MRRLYTRHAGQAASLPDWLAAVAEEAAYDAGPRTRDWLQREAWPAGQACTDA